MAKVSNRAFLNLERLVKDVQGSVTSDHSKQIASRVKDMMLKLIARGQSPIRGNDRFPAYKASSQIGKKKKGYPYNQKNKFPNKKPRPVNLFLSGAFLSSLRSDGKKNIISIGFDRGSLSAKKESGHREGVNSQPSRPIIPSRSERFSVTIEREIINMLRFIVKRAAKNKGK